MQRRKYWIIDFDEREIGGTLQTVFAATNFPDAKAAFNNTPSPGEPRTLWLARIIEQPNGVEDCTTLACK